MIVALVKRFSTVFVQSIFNMFYPREKGDRINFQTAETTDNNNNSRSNVHHPNRHR